MQQNSVSVNTSYLPTASGLQCTWNWPQPNLPRCRMVQTCQRQNTAVNT